MDADAFLAAAQDAYRGAADPARAAPMAAYMRGRFPFLGLPTPVRTALHRPLLRALDPAAAPHVARACWELAEREFQYLGCAVLQRHIARQPADTIHLLRHLITTRSWWDTVDHLASRCTGPLVRAHPELVGVMDDWAGAADIWLARTAIIHQLGFGDRTDVDRLFGYCLLRAGDREFFIRKAIGWALRQYARTDPDTVWGFVDAHRDALSPLSVREATRHR